MNESTTDASCWLPAETSANMGSSAVVKWAPDIATRYGQIPDGSSPYWARSCTTSGLYRSGQSGKQLATTCAWKLNPWLCLQMHAMSGTSTVNTDSIVRRPPSSDTKALHHRSKTMARGEV